MPSNSAGSPGDQVAMQQEAQNGDSNSFSTAVSHQRLYPTLPDDIAHTPPVDQTGAGAGDYVTAVQVPAAGTDDGGKGGNRMELEVDASASGEFDTAVQTPGDEEDPSSPSASKKLTRKSLIRAKHSQSQTNPQTALSPTVPINYAIQQLSEGRKDPATIRKELAEMYSERVDTDKGDPSIPPKPGRLGKRKVQFAEPALIRYVAPTSSKRHCDREGATLPPQGKRRDRDRGRGGSGLPHFLSPSSSPPLSQTRPSRSPDGQSNSWFAKLFRNN